MTGSSGGPSAGRLAEAVRRGRRAGRAPGTGARDAGQGALEYVGIVGLASLLVVTLLLAMSPFARTLAARVACELATLGQGGCATGPTEPDNQSPEGDDPGWWCRDVGWFCSEQGEEQEQEQEDEPGWFCDTLGWFCPDPTDDPTDEPTSPPTPTADPTDPSNGLPVVDGVTIPAGLDPDSEAVRTLLMTERGRAVLQWLADHGIEIRDSTQGSYWDGYAIYVDEDNTDLETVRTLVHEINHAQADATGDSPDSARDARDEYVDGMLDEETRGVVDEILASRELQDAGVDMPTDLSDDVYWEAYDRAVANGRTRQQARDVAFAAVRNLFLDGTFTTSNTNEPYDEYYGGLWDDKH